MAEIPAPIYETDIATLIFRAYEAEKEKPRPHMGCSQLGHHCDRWLFLSFRWAVASNSEGRILALFERGHNEEIQVVKKLQKIGVTVKDFAGDQARVNFGIFVQGSLDGRCLGVPGAEKTEHLLEIKTHSLASFNDLVKKGVKTSKFEHYVQMQLYMLATGLTRALYFAVCKNDDEIYTERVPFERGFADEYVRRGQDLALSQRLPKACRGASSSYYRCKFCKAYDFCHIVEDRNEVVEKNCRTCALVEPLDTSEFYCHKWKNVIPISAQYEACEHYRIDEEFL